MRTAPSLASLLDAAPPPTAEAPRPVVQPWTYLRMRREAAGLTIEEAARPYWHRPQHKLEVERILRFWESEGNRMKANFYAADMTRAYPMSVTVYKQLCLQPPHKHPRLCLACGWDCWSSQLDLHDHDVTWSAADPRICTLCEQLNRAPVIS